MSSTVKQYIMPLGLKGYLLPNDNVLLNQTTETIVNGRTIYKSTLISYDKDKDQGTFNIIGNVDFNKFIQFNQIATDIKLSNEN